MWPPRGRRHSIHLSLLLRFKAKRFFRVLFFGRAGRRRGHKKIGVRYFIAMLPPQEQVLDGGLVDSPGPSCGKFLASLGQRHDTKDIQGSRREIRICPFEEEGASFYLAQQSCPRSFMFGRHNLLAHALYRHPRHDRPA